MQTDRPWLRSIALVAALLLLDVSLTFQNVWPTPAIRWRGELSIELVVCLLVLVVARRWFGPPSRALLSVIGIFWTVLVVGHYADVTAPALYGREVNLYWDLRHVSAVAEMLASAASRWLVLGVIALAVVVLAVLYRALRWALGRVGDAMSNARERRAVGALAVAAAVLFAGQRVSGHTSYRPGFSTPVTSIYARQVHLVWNAHAAATGSHPLPPSPAMQGDLTLLGGADVLLLFIESYGAVTYERPEFAARLARDRAQLDAAIHETHREAVSAYVESPTFGGSSWLAHISLLSGVEVRDPDTNALLMTQKRNTLVTTFARHGYRTIGIMPGMWQSWPEGSFYGFDEIYGGERLNYRGPQFGWWDIPDQFALAQMDALELDRAPRAPIFLFFPTISTHVPFRPTPPYQPDWPRMLTAHPYDAADVNHAFDQQPDWLNLGPSYVTAMSYAYQSLAGYLRQRAGRDFVMILLGDHQPPAAVSGEGASWDVPVHVIASRRPVLDRLLSLGFQRGLTPAPPSIGHMHALVPLLLDAFGQRPSMARATP